MGCSFGDPRSGEDDYSGARPAGVFYRGPMTHLVRLPAAHAKTELLWPGTEPLWREAIGDVVREERLDRGERIADVAGRAGVAPQYLSEIERGRKDPSSEVLGALSGALDLTTGEVARRAAGQLARGPVMMAA